MNIAIVSPVSASSSSGNAVTARRWKSLLTDLGHQVQVRRDAPDDIDLLIVLHARKGARAIAASRAAFPRRPILLVMTGTDLYGDLPDSANARAAVDAADRIVVLHPGGVDRMPEAARAKTHVIHQSVPRSGGARAPAVDHFAVAVLAHLRDVKDPLCAARAAAMLPADSLVQVTLAGGAIDPEWDRAARAEQAANPRFEWVGELEPSIAAELLGSSHVLVVSSLMEGGANVVGEAIVLGVPVFATEIDGNVGLLGADYAGYFPVGDDAALAALMRRAETEPQFLDELTTHIERLAYLFAPTLEQAALATLVGDLVKPPGER